MVEIEFQLGRFQLGSLVDLSKWLPTVYVYSMGVDAFALTYEKNLALETQAEHKITAKTTMKSEVLSIFLPESFARDYFDNRKADVYKIEVAGHDVFLVLTAR